MTISTTASPSAATATATATASPATATTVPSARRIFGFPDIVNEVAARVVAGGVVAMTLAYLASGSGWVFVPLVYGFIARAAAGPTLSPLGRLAVHVIVPRLPAAERLVPGPPKRFAQSIGATLAGSAAIAHLAGAPALAFTLVAMITAAAFLESAFGFCLGCTIFAKLIQLGVVPEDTCEACNDLTKRVSA